MREYIPNPLEITSFILFVYSTHLILYSFHDGFLNLVGM